METNNEIKKYQTESTIVEAIKLKDNNSHQVAEFMNAVDFVDEHIPVPNKPYEWKHRLNVFVIDEGISHEYTISEGTFIVKSKDKFYCMSEDEFNDKFIQVISAHWIHDIHNGICDHEYTCSECRWGFDNPYDMYIRAEEFKYCPNCGAKMGEGNKYENL